MNFCRQSSKILNELRFCKKVNPHLCAFRNTWIVKRKYPPPVSRENAKQLRALKARHFVYETVEDTDLTEPPDLKVVLTTFVEGVGDVGDVISAMPFYVRESLLLPRKAVYATQENIERYSNLKKSRKETPKFSSIHAGMMVRNLSRVVIPVFMNSTNSWTMEKKHLHIAFRAEEFFVPLEAIELPETPITGPDLTQDGGDFAAFVTINNKERVAVRCRIFYIKPGLEMARLADELYLEKGEPILSEQRELLDDMPEPQILDDPSANISIVEKYRIQYLQ